MKIHAKTAIPLAAVFAAMLMVGITPAFAEVTISAAEGSGAPGCEETAEGCYLPGTATVDVGGMVIMSNPDTAAHTFTAGSPTDGPTGEFDTGLLMAGGSFEYSPNTAGEIPYFCMVHPWMKGTIIVQEAGAQMGGSMMDDKMKDGSMMDDKMMMSMKMDLNEIMAEIKTSDGMANEPMTIDLMMTDLEGNGIEHITYKIKATQGSEMILDDEGHMHKGTIMNTHMTSALPMDASETMPVVLSVESVGFGHDDLYVDVPGEIATKQVVPEFGTIAVMILAVAIISIIAVSARSRLSIMPRL
ncbi:MAG: PEFG-CTERM sorting domain-containing protein [Nitrosopumilus sp.]|nr:PEFG-CTERM sorting domain-containing protein [Nitrosopumilus sp.]